MSWIRLDVPRAAPSVEELAAEREKEIENNLPKVDVLDLSDL